MASSRSVNRLVPLAEELIRRTEAGRIRWNDFGGGIAFEVKTPSASVLVDTVDGDGEQPYRLTVRNREGLPIDELAQEWTTTSEGRRPSPWNDIMRDLYEIARRSAFDVDQLLDHFLEELDSPPQQAHEVFDDEPPF
jgi:hypothetical protein